jgi:hypothetical protein
MIMGAWGGARKGAGRKKNPIVVVKVAAAAWPAGTLKASSATVDELARACSPAAMATLMALAERGATERIRVRAASRLLDIADRLGVLRPASPSRH